jgi:glycerol kinase
MQFQADLLGVPVAVAAERETTGLGAAALAAPGAPSVPAGEVFEPRIDRDRAAELRAAWHEGLRRARTDTPS